MTATSLKAKAYDLCFHAVDLAYLRDELVPWLRGVGTDFPRVEEGARRLHTRYLANQFGFALLDRCTPRPKARPNALARQLGQLISKAERLPDPANVDVPATLGAFHPERHLFGRPFLIGATGVEAVGTQVDRYREATTDEHVLELARQHLDAIAPGASLAEPPWVSLDRDYAAERVADALRTMREVLTRREPNAEDPPTHDARLDRILLALVDVAGTHGATWMARGPGPSTLLEGLGVQLLEMEDAFSFASDLFPVMPRLKWEIEQTIAHPADLGALAEPHQVPGLRAAVLRNRSGLLKLASPIYLEKLDECLAYAEFRGLAFIESSGVMRRRDLVAP